MLDVNVVIAIYRPDHVHHEVARPWFESLVRTGDEFAVPDEVWASFVRIVTNRRAFLGPSTTPETFGFIRSVRAQHGHVDVRPGPRRLPLFERLCTDGEATGDLVADAFLASLAVESGCSIASFDRDFARFEHLRWERPVAP